MRGRRTSKVTWTSTAGSTPPATRSDPTRSPPEAGRLFRLLPGPARPRRGGNIKPKNEWLHKVKWDLVVFDEYHFGAWRETAKELFEGEEERSPRRRPSSSTPRAGGRERRPQRALGEGDRVPAHHYQGVSLPLRHAVQGAGHGRVHRGADLQLDVHRRAARKEEFAAKNPGNGTPTARCRRCAC